jgi:hypothetical protein
LASDPAISNGSFTFIQERTMMTANVSRDVGNGLPRDLKIAQAAILLPEVQEMLRRLSDYKLGIFMPHMHTEQTGEFEGLPDDLVQVESGLAVSFRASEEVEREKSLFMPVGWLWRGGKLATAAACEMVHQDESSDTETVKHKMPPSSDRSVYKESQ